MTRTDKTFSCDIRSSTFSVDAPRGNEQLPSNATFIIDDENDEEQLDGTYNLEEVEEIERDEGYPACCRTQTVPIYDKVVDPSITQVPSKTYQRSGNATYGVPGRTYVRQPRSDLGVTYDITPEYTDLGPWQNFELPSNIQQLNLPPSAIKSFPITQMPQPPRTFSTHEDQQPILNVKEVAQYRRAAPRYYSTPESKSFKGGQGMEGSTLWGQDMISFEPTKSTTEWFIGTTPPGTPPAGNATYGIPGRTFVRQPPSPDWGATFHATRDHTDVGPWRNVQLPENIQQLNISPGAHKSFPITQMPQPAKTFSTHQDQQPILFVNEVERYRRAAPRYYSTPESKSFKGGQGMEGSTLWGQDISTFDPTRSSIGWSQGVRMDSFNVLKYMTPSPKNIKVPERLVGSYPALGTRQRIPYPNLTQYSRGQVTFRDPKSPSFQGTQGQPQKTYTIAPDSLAGGATFHATRDLSNIRPWGNIQIPANLRRTNLPLGVHKSFPATNVPRPSRNYSTYEEDILNVPEVAQYRRRVPRFYSTPKTPGFTNEGIDMSTLWGQDLSSFISAEDSEVEDSSLGWSQGVRMDSFNVIKYMTPSPKNVKVPPRLMKSHPRPERIGWHIPGPNYTRYSQKAGETFSRTAEDGKPGDATYSRPTSGNATYSCPSAPNATYSCPAAADATFSKERAADATFLKERAADATFSKEQAADATYSCPGAQDATYSCPGAQDAPEHSRGGAADATFSKGRAANETFICPGAQNATFSKGGAADATFSRGKAADATFSKGRAANETYTYPGAQNATFSRGGAADATFSRGRAADATFSKGRVANETFTYPGAQNATFSRGRAADATFSKGRAANETFTYPRAQDATFSKGRVANETYSCPGAQDATFSRGRAADATYSCPGVANATFSRTGPNTTFSCSGPEVAELTCENTCGEDPNATYDRMRGVTGRELELYQPLERKEFATILQICTPSKSGPSLLGKSDSCPGDGFPTTCASRDCEATSGSDSNALQQLSKTQDLNTIFEIRTPLRSSPLASSTPLQLSINVSCTDPSLLVTPDRRFNVISYTSPPQLTSSTPLQSGVECLPCSR
ncbi:hypothetical protein HHI36_007281 [Cryptolaemus montrouzieri]|uniref:Uncharacterized protein n=1 Tax=Cryptolaemus montrouzieri TaxID=559131 RepID=A0ABD2MP81_9CUCU